MIAPNTQLPTVSAGVLNSPRALSLFAFGLFASAIACLAIDMPMVRFMRDTEPPGDIQRMVDFAEGFGHGLGVALIIVTVALLANSWKKAAILAIYAYGAGLICDAAKIVVARHRPYHEVDWDGRLADTFIAWLPWFNGVPVDQPTSSFPSAHTATAFGLAIGLSRLYPRGRYVFFGCATMGAIQRLDSYAHYASDVCAGAAIAFCVASLMACKWTVASQWIREDPKEPSISGEGRSEILPRTERPPRRCA